MELINNPNPLNQQQLSHLKLGWSYATNAHTPSSEQIEIWIGWRKNQKKKIDHCCCFGWILRSPFFGYN